MSQGTRNSSLLRPAHRAALGIALALTLALVLALGGVLALSTGCEKLDAGTATTTSTVSPDGTTTTLAPSGTASSAGAPGATAGPTPTTAAGATGSGTTLGVVSAAPATIALTPMVTTPTWTLYQETDPHITYSTNPEGGALWTSGDYPEASGGKIMWTVWRGTTARIKMRFNGTGIALVVLKNIDCCKARLTLDGGASFLVDTYGAPMNSAVVWTSPDLAPGVHSLTIESTNSHNPSSADYYLLFDAVSVRGTLVY